MTRLRRRIAALALAAALGGAALTPAATATDAAFTDTEHANATLTALRLQPPTITGVTCSRPALLNPGAVYLTITWRWPDAGAPYSGYSAANASWTTTAITPVAGSPTPAAPTTTVANGVYTTTFTGTLLGNLLGGLSNLLLGSSFSADVVTTGVVGTGTTTWTSPTRSGVTMTIPPLAGASCSVN
ncbi:MULTISPECIES: hypothetical protein [unclassified Microbacterium]|uniref:hypothetical protein n=1 Tax=Microbacterium sp. JZ37 TaxID=2654193 RepID=UPI002B48DED5|nr:hypothetical protein [Microbacterium sp. JZ37]WRH16644.1 hypothetical protein GC092_03325 [Microbacterium sp. JZ37]